MLDYCESNIYISNNLLHSSPKFKVVSLNVISLSGFLLVKPFKLLKGQVS